MSGCQVRALKDLTYHRLRRGKELPTCDQKLLPHPLSITQTYRGVGVERPLALPSILSRSAKSLVESQITRPYTHFWL